MTRKLETSETIDHLKRQMNACIQTEDYEQAGIYAAELFRIERLQRMEQIKPEGEAK